MEWEVALLLGSIIAAPLMNWWCPLDMQSCHYKVYRGGPSSTTLVSQWFIGGGAGIWVFVVRELQCL